MIERKTLLAAASPTVNMFFGNGRKKFWRLAAYSPEYFSIERFYDATDIVNTG